jgi:hypothetical protein
MPNNESKDNFDNTEGNDKILIGAIESIAPILEKSGLECMIIINTEPKPIVWTVGKPFDLVKMSAPIIRALKDDIFKSIDC